MYIHITITHTITVIITHHATAYKTDIFSNLTTVLALEIL